MILGARARARYPLSDIRRGRRNRACGWKVFVVRALHGVPVLGVAVDKVVVCVKVKLLPWRAVRHCVLIQRDVIGVDVGGHDWNMFNLGVICPDTPVAKILSQPRGAQTTWDCRGTGIGEGSVGDAAEALCAFAIFAFSGCVMAYQI